MARRRLEDMQVIVCGPYRSGTSLMMRCLEMAGFKMAEDLTPGDKGNIYGYYESERFMDLCYEIYSRNLERQEGERKPDLENLRRLLGEKGKWAWKAPFAVFILDELFEAGENVIPIYMSRPKADVLSSWIRFCEIKMKGKTPYPEEPHAQWYDQSLKLFQAYRQKKIKVNFLDLVDNEKIVMNEILDFLGLETNYDCTAVDIREVHFKD